MYSQEAIANTVSGLFMAASHVLRKGDLVFCQINTKGGRAKTETPPSPFLPTLQRGRDPALRDFQPLTPNVTDFF